MDDFNNQNNFNQNNQQYNNAYQENQVDCSPQQYPMYNDDQHQKNDGKAIASLVLGIVGLVLFCCCAGIYCSIPGLVLGIVSKKNRPQNNGMAIAGIVLSAIGVLVGLFMVLNCIFGFVSFYTLPYMDGYDFYDFYY